MKKTLFEENGITSLGSVDDEEDLKPKRAININHPPMDESCDCCGRPLCELKPFGKAGDPPDQCDCCGRHLSELSPFIEGDPVMDCFNAKLLARRHRPDATPTKEVNKMMVEFVGDPITYLDHHEAGKKLAQKYAKENAFEVWAFAFFLDDPFKQSWECRDCIVLDTCHYFEKKMAQEWDNEPDSPG